TLPEDAPLATGQYLRANALYRTLVSSHFWLSHRYPGSGGNRAGSSHIDPHLSFFSLYRRLVHSYQSADGVGMGSGTEHRRNPCWGRIARSFYFAACILPHAHPKGRRNRPVPISGGWTHH